MADEINIDELQRSMDDLRNTTQKSAMGVDEWNRKLKKAGEDMAKAAKQSSAEMAKGATQFAKGLAGGQEDFKTFNDAVGAAGNAAAGLARALPVFGNALGEVLQAATGAAQFLVTQVDATAKSFQTLANVGASTAGGMSALRDMQVKSGLSLQNFSKVVADNSVAFARFGSTAGDGAERFSEAVQEFTTGNDNSLRNLGMNAEQIGQTTAAFVKQQSRLGRAQELDARALQAGTKQYAIELDTLTKLTGMNKDAIQQQQDAVLSEARFRANYEDLVDQGRVKEAKALMDLQTRMSSFGAELGQGIRDLTSGAANTDAAIKMMNSTGGAALDIVNRLKSGAIDQNQAQIELQNAYKSQRETLKQNAKFMGTSNEALGNFAQEADFMSQDLAKGTARAKAATAANVNADDAMTKSVNEAQKNIESLARDLDTQIIKALPKVGEAVKLTTDQFKNLTKAIDTAISGKPADENSMIGKIYNRINSLLGRGGGTSGGSGGGGSAPAPSPAPGGGAAAPSTPGTLGSGPPAIKPEDYIEFGPNTGSRDHFGKLQPAVQQQFLQMAKDYNNLTGGKKLRVNSAFRSPEEQSNVDSGTNPRAAPGMSLHQQGRAIDINSDQRRLLESSGLLSNYGFSPLANDPPHIFARDGFSGMISGPQGGYKPNLTMHGTEDISIKPTTGPSAVPDTVNTEIFTAQLAKLDELVSVMKSQLAVSGKILAYAS